jgi:hypothetical protein
MIKSLRKRHLQIWAAWAVLLPIGIIAAWLAVPKPVIDKLLQPESSASLPVLVKSIERKSFTANLKTNSDKSQYQLEWITKEVSTVPSSLIYKASPNPASPRPSPKEREEEGGALEESELIGRIQTRGTYYFNISTDSTDKYNIILYDIIKKKIIDSLNFFATGGVR